MLAPRIFWVIQLLLVAILGYFAYQYIWAQDIKLVAQQKWLYLLKANQNFRTATFVICPVILMVSILHSWKIKSTQMVFTPYLIAALATFLYFWNEENTYIFKKQNNVFDATYPLSMIFAVVQIIGILLLFLLHLFIFKKIWVNKK